MIWVGNFFPSSVCCSVAIILTVYYSWEESIETVIGVFFNIFKTVVVAIRYATVGAIFPLSVFLF